jgi:hypothetical protein
MAEKEAFPSSTSYSATHFPGMTLRDYFAGQALTATYLAHADRDWTIANIAERVYQVADAMLKERDK